MLLRVSRKRLPLATRQALLDADSLQLPFLCPALFRPPAQSRATSSASQNKTPLRSNKKSPRRPSRLGNEVSHTAHRGLASAAAIEYQPSHDYIPFGPFVGKPSELSKFGPETIPALHGYETRPLPLILDDTPMTTPGKFRSVDGISGDINEIHQTLHASLRIGRLERATALLRRLGQLYKPDAPGLLAAHKDYLREMTASIIKTKSMSQLQDLLTWFELEIRRPSIPQDAEVFALIIQACLQDYNPKSQRRAVRRYYNLARDAGVEEETKQKIPELENAFQGLDWYTNRLPMPTEQKPPVSGKSDSAIDPASMPIRAVDFRGQGLSTLRKSLSTLVDHTAVDNPSGNPDAEAAKSLRSRVFASDVERQRHIEENTVNAAVERWKSENEQLKSIGINNSLHDKSPIGALMWTWHEQFKPLVEEEMKLAEEAETKGKRTEADDNRLQWGPYLGNLSSDKISALTILGVMQFASTGESARGVKLVTLVHRLSRMLREETVAELSKKDRHFNGWRTASQKRVQASWQSKLRGSPDESAVGGEPELYNEARWPSSVAFKVGAMLLSKLMSVARVEVSRKHPKTGREVQESRPVLFHTYQYLAGKRVGVVMLNSAILESMSKAPVGSALAKYLPMVCEPKPWSGFNEGGFLEQNLKVVRSHSSDQYSRSYIMTACENGDMIQLYKGLDVLGRTSWKINQRVFAVMVEAWNSGKAVADIPPEHPDVEMPQEPPASTDRRERRKWLMKVQEVENHKTGLRSQRCFMNFQMEIARAFVNETFYLPHNVDFRGRAYPMAPFLNHMGADNARGLLQFGGGKKLGEQGLWWLKVHLANVYGYDKASFKERQVFTEENVAEISDSALHPLDGRRWWLRAEDPWQCLATCMELHEALQLDDPTEYISHIPVHQDGTCNGLQHYAALGGDIIGAKQVNLEPGERPSDIYTAVAEDVKADIKKDAENGNPVAEHLDGHVTRKVVKQTVMTNVYGVTLIGANQQVRRQLADTVKFPEEGDVTLRDASLYVAKKIFRTLGNMFNGAHDIQFWLGDCGNRICDSVSPGQIARVERELNGEKTSRVYARKDYKNEDDADLLSFLTPITWTTPLKLPVVQPYRKNKNLHVKTEIQSLWLRKQSAQASVDKTKQLQGFPPNFIHSLDGTHMFLTALRCDELGISFASVHDSFWTHAADINTMNKVTRDAFVRMHSENIVARLHAEFETRYKGYMQLASVSRGSRAGKKILKWRRAHPRVGIDAIENPGGSMRKGKISELMMETKRLRLLASENAEERKEGEGMETPGSIFHNSADDETLAGPDRLPTTIGERGKVGKVGLESKRQAREAKTETLEEQEGDAVDIDDLAGLSDDIADEESGASAIESEEEVAESKPKKKAKQGERAKVWFWMPLEFPPVPEKGEFDVRRLKDSLYFFS